MTKEQTASLNNEERYLITPSLLNSWAYIWECVDYVRENENDEISYDDKCSNAIEKAKNDFIVTLNRLKTPPNEYMLRGIQYEEDSYKGLTRASPYVKGGQYQVVGMKNIEVDGVKFLLYGRLDCLKGGVISDIKRVSNYSAPKYKTSFQHVAYFELFPKAYEFDYLIDDGNKLHIESYYPDDVTPIRYGISDFIKWLKANNLWELYKEKWRSRND